MFNQEWSRVHAASVAPVVVISASGLLCLAFYNRLAAIVSRLRTFQRERLHELEQIARLEAGHNADDASSDADVRAIAIHRRVLDTLGVQTARVLARARLIRMTLQCLLGTVAALVISSIFNGLTLLWPAAAAAAAVFFLLGMGSLLTGAVAAMIELAGALDVVELESELLSELTDDSLADHVASTPARPRLAVQN